MPKEFPIGHEISGVMHYVSQKILNNTNFLEESLIQSLKKKNSQSLTKSQKIPISRNNPHISRVQLTPLRNPQMQKKDDGKLTLKLLTEKFSPQKTEVKENPVIVDPNFKS